MGAPSHIQIGLAKGLSGFTKGFGEGYEKEDTYQRDVSQKRMLQEALDKRRKEERGEDWTQNSVPLNIQGQLDLKSKGYDFNVGDRIPVTFASSMSGTASRERTSGKGRGPGGIKLNPDQRYNEDTDTVEAIPGSKLYLQQADKHKKDIMALNTSRNKSETAKTKIQAILKDPEALKSQFGGYGALATRFLHPDAKVKIDSLKSNLMAAGLEIMKNGGGIGQITEREWPIMESMISKLSPTMSQEEAQQQLEFIQQKYDSIVDQAQQAYDLEWGNTPYVKPMRTDRNRNQAAPAPAAGDYSELWK